jgi:hypothetical protein
MLTMARIRNSMVPNTFGEGNEKIITLDNGEEYIVRNSMVPNTFGDGYEQEIVNTTSRSSSAGNGTLFLLGLILLIYVCLLGWLCNALLDVIHPIFILVMGAFVLFFGIVIWASSYSKK